MRRILALGVMVAAATAVALAADDKKADKRHAIGRPRDADRKTGPLRFDFRPAATKAAAAGAPATSSAPATRPKRDTAGADKLGWRLAIHAYSFRGSSFFEAVDQAAALCVRDIEAYPNQKISRDIAGGFGHDMKPEARSAVRAKLQAAGVRLAGYGVVGLANNDATCRRVFDFAREMGIETLVAEPTPGSLELVDKLAEEYGVRVAIHNQPKPGRYWDPGAVLAACDGRSRWLGACADTGHWFRSGVAPVAGLRRLRGRIVSVHLKDLSDAGGHDVPWGAGAADVAAQLAELAASGYTGLVSIEYQHHTVNTPAEVARCVDFFDKTATALAAAKK